MKIKAQWDTTTSIPECVKLKCLKNTKVVAQLQLSHIAGGSVYFKNLSGSF